MRFLNLVFLNQKTPPGPIKKTIEPFYKNFTELFKFLKNSPVPHRGVKNPRCPEHQGTLDNMNELMNWFIEGQQ